MFKGFRYFMRYCWRQQKSYVLYLLLGEAFQTAAFVAGVVFPKFIIDSLFGEQEISKAVWYAAGFLALLFLSNVMQALSRYRAERSRDQMYRKFSISYARRVMESDYCKMEDPAYLDLREKALKCMSGDYGFAGTVLLAVNLLGKILLIGSIIAIVMTLDVVMLLICALLIAANVWMNNSVGKKNAQIDLDSVSEKRKEDYYHGLGDDTVFAKEIRLNGLHHWILDLYREQFARVHRFTRKRNANTCKGMAAGRLCTFLQQCTAYGYLAYRVLGTGLSMGGFAMYLNAVLSFNSAITELLTIVGRIRQCGIYLEPFKEFMECSGPVCLEDKDRMAPLENDAAGYVIRFDHVSFRYPGQEEYALKDVSCEIRACEKVAVVGENGAGKSTFVKLLTRLYDPTQGCIYLNGRDIRTIDRQEYLKLFSVVFQDYKLFAVTVRENIGLDRSDGIDSRELDALADSIGLKEKIDGLELGFDTAVYKMFDDKGFEPSGGEGQKIAIARAFVKNSPIVVLDEPTAALDPRAEYEIYRDFSRLSRDKTAVYISHRLASCRICDRILVFLDGGIAQRGTHEELMAQEGYYADIFKMQMALYHEEVSGNV